MTVAYNVIKKQEIQMIHSNIFIISFL